MSWYFRTWDHNKNHFLAITDNKKHLLRICCLQYFKYIRIVQGVSRDSTLFVIGVQLFKVKNIFKYTRIVQGVSRVELLYFEPCHKMQFNPK